MVTPRRTALVMALRRHANLPSTAPGYGGQIPRHHTLPELQPEIPVALEVTELSFPRTMIRAL